LLRAKQPLGFFLRRFPGVVVARVLQHYSFDDFFLGAPRCFSGGETLG
jgi:hypothetical protein